MYDILYKPPPYQAGHKPIITKDGSKFMALTPPLSVIYNDAKTSLEVSPIGSGKFLCARVLSTQPVSTGREPLR